MSSTSICILNTSNSLKCFGNTTTTQSSVSDFDIYDDELCYVSTSGVGTCTTSSLQPTSNTNIS